MDKKKAKEQIQCLSMLEDNWNTYGAKAFKKDTIRRATMVVNAVDSHFSDPFIAPSDAGVQFEWMNKGNAIEIYIDEDIDSIGYLKTIGEDIKDWSEGTFQDYNDINEFLEWLFKEEKIK